MKTHRLPLLVLTVLLGARLSAQDIPANDVAQALDDLKTATLNKIDGEIEINARAFADAQNIQNSLFWNDLFRPFMDIAMGVYDGLTDLPTKRPDSVRAWMKTTLQGANAAKSFFSVLGSFDRLIQDGENLELTLDGPAYNGLVTAMLDRASATGSHLLFDYQAYKQSVMNDLYGAAPVNSPFRVAHKSIAVDRSGGGSFDSVLAARTYIAGQFTSLSSQMRATSLPPARIAEMVSFLRARRQDVLQSRIGQTSVTYEAYLLNGPTLVKRQVTYSLGTIGQLEQWRGTMLDAFVRNLGYDMIGISVRVAEKAGEFVTDSLVDDAFKTVNLNLSVEAVVAGQQEANLVLKEASSLGMAVLKPDVGDLADRLQSYVSSSREQINMTPESMMDAFPGEVSKVLLLVDDAIKFTQTLAASPNVTSITPNILTAVALPQTQALTIIGTGFTTGSRLNFLYGTIEFTDRLPSFTSATELHYDIGIGERPGNWTAKVVNGVQESDPFSLIVVPPPTPGSGSLSVTLQPSGAVAAGAQWRVDSGSYRNHGDTATGLTPGSHTVSFKTVTGYTAPTDHTVTITAGTAASDSGNYTPIAAATYALTLSPGGSMGSSTPSPVGTMNGGALVYTAGTLVQLTANANLGYHFVGWGGDLTGTANPTSLTMNGNKSVTANFASGDPNMGTIIVTLLPSAAAAAGVTWGFNSSDFRASGSSYTTWPATYALSLHPVDGWLAPPALVATITAGQTANYSATFTADTTPGLLTVTLTPPGAVAAGAKWRVNGGAPQGNGSTLSLSPGTDYTISFDPVSGWTPPANQTVTVRRAQTTATAGNYVPPAGRPVIASVSPPVGPLAGGTLLTINGVNFSAPVGVTVGGQPATGVNLASPTSVTCLTPPSSVYGTTNVIVETVGGRATNVSGFTYGIPRGSGFDLMNSFGGRSYGIWVQGNYAYVGEGKSLLVMDVSVPANPWRIGRVQLPGTVRGIAVSGQYAYVASSEGGLQVVDISAPAAPIVRGFYPTSSWTDGVAVLGGRAYVADEGVGLEILDVSNPAMPTLVASTNCGGTAVDIVVKGSANGVFAYLSTGGQVCVLDVSDPSIPVLRGTCSIDYIGSLAVSGTRVFAASIITGLHMVDVSNPDAPRDLGTASGTFTPRAVATANNVIYAIDNDPSYGFYIYTINGTALTLVGHTTGVGSSGTHMMVSGNRAFIAGGTSGFEIVDVSNPAGPSALGRFTDSGLFGQYGPVTAFGHYLYTANDGGFRVVDVADPASPTVAWSNDGLAMSNPNSRILVANSYAYLVDGSVRILNLANQAAPVLMPNSIPVSTLHAYDGVIVGNYLVLVGLDSAYVGKLMTFDLSSPASPAQRGSLTLAAPGNYDPGVRIAAKGSKAVVAMNSGAFRVIDLSNMSLPVERGQIASSGYPRGLAMSSDGQYAYAISGNPGAPLRVLDIRNPASPSVVHDIPVDALPGCAVEIGAVDLYVASWEGLYVFDTSVPSLPSLKRSYLASAIAGIGLPGLGSVSDRVYLADSDGGIVALSEQDLQAPAPYITNPTFSPVYTNSGPTMSLGGGADDNVGVTRIIWSNNRGGGGEIIGAFDDWFVSDIVLLPGSNVLTVVAFDAVGNWGSDALTVIYQAPKQNQSITFPSVPSRTFGDMPFPLVAAASSGLPVRFGLVSGPASLADNTVSLLGAGTVTLNANQSGDDYFNPAPPTNVTFTVARADQAIVLAGFPDKSAGDPPFGLSATASSGLPVYFSIASGPAAVDGGMVTLIGGGLVTLRAWQPGNSNYNAAATVEHSFNIAKIPQTITFGPLSRQTLGDAPFPLAASANSGLPVGYDLISGPAVVSGNLVTVTNTGLVVVRASQAGNAFYAPATNVFQSFMVAPGYNLITAYERLANGKFTLVFIGEFGRPYAVEFSTNLTVWTPIVTNFVDNLGNLSFTDWTSTNRGAGFYRVKAQ